MIVHRAFRSAYFRSRRSLGAVAREVGTEVDRVRYRKRGRADLALFHEFAQPPTGGGHQFLRALVGEFERRGLAVETNRISSGTPVCLFNSFNFDFRRLRRFARCDCRMVHRVDGPIGVYRGRDDGTDDRIATMNRELADATVVQSLFSLKAHQRIGIELRDPVVVRNTVDPAIFHPPDSRRTLDRRKVRLIASSWSDNPRKGSDVFRWLDRNLDWTRFEMTFVGRTSIPFERIRCRGPVKTRVVADLLRAHDVYVAASLDDPCSNALLEALACGLPALFRQSGGHPELVDEAGIGFDRVETIAAALDLLVEEYDERRAAIAVPSLVEVADRYLEILVP